MVFGVCPWKIADKSDQLYVRIMNGELIEILTSWKRLHYATTDLIKLFNDIFQIEEKRIGLEEIKKSKWCKI